MSQDTGEHTADLRPAQPKDHAGLLASLLRALLDFEQMPGRYRLALREPQAVFEQMHTVLLLAAGRSVEGLAPLVSSLETGAAQRAARFFVRTVMLRPGTDHYTLLGLASATFEPEALRDHYRLMIRMTHPDFAASGENWPANAAVRINTANDVLSSPVKRELYDAAQCAARPAQPRGAEAMGTMGSSPLEDDDLEALRRTSKPRRTQRSIGFWRWGALAAGGAVFCTLGLWLMTPSGSDDSLVARRAIPGEASQPSPKPQSTLALADAGQVPAEVPTPTRVNAVAQTVSDGLPAIATMVKAKGTQAEDLSARRPERLAHDAGVALEPRANALKAQRKPPDSLAVASVIDSAGLTLVAETHLTFPRATAAGSAKPVVTMEQVQPALSRMIEGLQTGQAQNVVRLLEGHWREHPAASSFVNRYEQLLAGDRVADLGNVSFRSRTEGEFFVVDGVIELKLQDTSGEVSRSKNLHISAYFLPRDGAPMFTQVVARQAR